MLFMTALPVLHEVEVALRLQAAPRLMYTTICLAGAHRLLSSLEREKTAKRVAAVPAD